MATKSSLFQLFRKELKFLVPLAKKLCVLTGKFFLISICAKWKSNKYNRKIEKCIFEKPKVQKILTQSQFRIIACIHAHLWDPSYKAA